MEYHHGEKWHEIFFNAFIKFSLHNSRFHRHVHAFAYPRSTAGRSHTRACTHAQKIRPTTTLDEERRISPAPTGKYSNSDETLVQPEILLIPSGVGSHYQVYSNNVAYNNKAGVKRSLFRAANLLFDSARCTRGYEPACKFCLISPRNGATPVLIAPPRAPFTNARFLPSFGKCIRLSGDDTYGQLG